MERNEQIESLYPLALALAKKISYQFPRLDPDDIVSDASLGIILAVDRFDASRGISLRLYAAHKVYTTIFNGMRRRDPVSERVRRTLRQATRHRYELALELSRLPTLVELEQDVPGLREARIRHARMDVQLLGDSDTRIGDLRSDPQRVFEDESTLAGLRAAIARLPQRQRKIVDEHYHKELPLRAIGNEMHVTPQRISQLHITALRDLRSELKTALSA